MSDLDDKLAQWREQTEAVKPPAELMAQLTALAVAQAAASGAAGAAGAGVAPAAGKAVAAKGVMVKVWLSVIAAGIVGGGVLASRGVAPHEAPAVVAVTPAPLTPTKPATPPVSAPVPLAAAVLASKNGFLTVHANKPATVILDGVNLGSAPIVHRVVRAGKHQLLINCLRDGGNYSAGVQRIEVQPSTELDVTNTCVERLVLIDGGVVPDQP